MLVFYYLYLLTANVDESHSADTVKANVILDIIARHIRTFHLYQTAVFFNSTDKSDSIVNYNFVKMISSRNPAVVISPNELESPSNNVFEANQYFYHRQSTLIVIVQGKLSSAELLSTLDYYVDLMVKGIRPRCLVVLSDPTAPIISIEAVLYSAWKRKFLDVSMINVSPKPEIFNYNPFSRSYSCEAYTAETDIFPNKLLDMKGYSINVPFINSEPDMFVDRDINDHTEYSGTGFSIIKYAGYAMNFNVNVVTDFGGFMAAFGMLKDSELNLLCFPLFVTESLMAEKLEIGKIYGFEAYRAMIIPRTALSISVSFLTFLPFALSVMLVFAGAYVLNVTRRHLRVFDILRMVFGQPALDPPKPIPERIVFITIAILSIIFLPTVIAKIAGMIVPQQPPPIGSFKDALDARLQPYAFLGLIELLSNEDDKYSNLMMADVISYNDSDYCLGLLLSSKEHTMCFTPETQAKMYANKYRSPEGGPMIKLTDIRVSLMASAMIYEEGSPFIEKFDELVQRIFESGVSALWGPNYPELQSTDREGASITTNGHIFSVQMSLMYLCGCALAFFAFIVELLVDYVRRPT